MGFLNWLKNLFDPQPMYSPAYLPMNYDDVAPPAYTSSPATATLPRISFSGNPVFPSQSITGSPPCSDLDGVSPVFFGSAHFPDSSIHPCKIAPALGPSLCRVSYGGQEHHHSGPYSLLPFNPDTMELVPATAGQIPHGRRPVQGGHERDSKLKLYHAVANISVRGRAGRTVRVPGKTAPHLSGCNVAWDGEEKVLRSNYEILCWKEGVAVNDVDLKTREKY